MPSLILSKGLLTSNGSRDYWSRGLPWVTKGSLAMLDQGLMSGSNFLTTILLARWLAPAQYGAYAMAFSIFVLLACIHECLIIEPMTVFGPSSYRDRQPEYLAAVMRVQGLFGLVCFILLAFAAFLSHHFKLGGGLPSALVGLSISGPCVYTLFVVRNAFYLAQRPASSAAGSFVYSTVLLGGVLAVYKAGQLSPLTAFVMVTLASLVSMAVLMNLKLAWKSSGGETPSLRGIWQQHWNYGRWALGTGTVKWIPANIFYALTGTLLGMAEVGSLKAVLNLFLPVAQAANSLSNLFQPFVAGVFGREGLASTKGPVFRVMGLYFVGGLVYWALLTTFAKTMFLWLYGGKFMDSAPLVPWVAMGAMLTVTSYGPTLGLRAIQCPYSVFVAYSAAGVVSIGLGIIATWAYGMPGTIWTFVLSSFTLLVVATYQFYKKTRIPSGGSCEEWQQVGES